VEVYLEVFFDLGTRWITGKIKYEFGDLKTFPGFLKGSKINKITEAKQLAVSLVH